MSELDGRRVGMWLIGAFGGVGTTVALGMAALRRGLIDATGLVTTSPLFDEIDLDEPSQFVLGGHDVRRTSYLKAVEELHERSNLFDRDMSVACKAELDLWSQNVRPGTVLNAGSTIEKLVDIPEVHQKDNLRAAVEGIQSDLRQFRENNRLDQIVVINVASTEPPFELTEAHQSLAKFLTPLECRNPAALPASSLYAWAAIDMGVPYINFTPSLGASFPAIEELKIRTKDQVISQIVGYKPQTHVSIEFIESLDDWKTAWDFIHFQGFLGVKMNMQFTWQGCDSILAAPLVIDLARLGLLAQRRGEAGILRHLACFFKSPMGVEEHDFFKQLQLLEKYAGQVRQDVHV